MTKRLSFPVYLIIAVVIFLLAFYLRTAELRQVSLWLDEAYTTDTLRIIHEDGDFVASVKARFNHMPLYFASILLYPGDHSDFSLRYPSALWSLLTIAMTLRILTHLYHYRRYALLTGFLLAVHSLVIIQGREARMYPMSNFLVVTAAYFFLRNLQQADISKMRWFGFIGASILAYLTHIASFMLIPAQGFLLLAHVVTRRLPSRTILYWGILQVIMMIPAMLWIITIFEVHPGRLDWVPLPDIERIVFVIGQLFYGHLDLVGVGWERALVLVILPLVITLVALRNRHWLYWIGLTWASLITLVIVSYLVQPVFDERYLSVGIFAYFILLVMGYKTLGDFILLRYRFAGMILIGLLVGIQLMLSMFATGLRFSTGTFSQVYHKQAFAYVSENSQPDDIVVTTNGIYLLTWYMDDSSLQLWDKTETDIVHYMTTSVPTDNRLWVATSIFSAVYDTAQRLEIEPVYRNGSDLVYLLE